MHTLLKLLNPTTIVHRAVPILLLVVTLASCSDDGEPLAPTERPFLQGTEDDPQIGLVVNSTGRALTLFQLGAPEESRQVPLGASSSVTPVGLSVRGSRVVVPLGNAASVALIDPANVRVDRFFLFPGGNATGSAFVDDQTVLVANQADDYVGRFRIDQSGDQIGDSVSVAATPTSITLHDGRAFVVSSNLDEDFQPLGDGVVTALDPETMQVEGTVPTGGTNPQFGAFGPDGMLYVVNTADFASPGSLAIIDPETMERVDVIDGMGVGPGQIWIGEDGRAYISGFFFGTLVWDTESREFIRGPDNPVCAPLEDGSCRGAFDAEVDDSGRLYQVFFGSARQGLEPWVFVYQAGSYELTDSVAVGTGPAAIDIHTF